MARTVQKHKKRSMKSQAAVPVADTMHSQGLVDSDRGDGKASEDELRRTMNEEAASDRSAGPSGSSGTELEDWLAAKKEFDRQLKRL
ncbi:MAG TPA: hypothetical protein VF931_10390 [Steroidobacteraceae bacterium]